MQINLLLAKATHTKNPFSYFVASASELQIIATLFFATTFNIRLTDDKCL